MEVALSIFAVLAIAADFVTIYLFIESRIEKRNAKRKK